MLLPFHEGYFWYFFFKQRSILQVDSYLHASTLWPYKQQKYNSWIFTISHLCYLLIFLDLSHCQILCFFPLILQYPKGVFAWYLLQPERLLVSWNPYTVSWATDIQTPLLSTPSEFLQMVLFCFHKFVFDIMAALFQATSFVV